MLCRLSAFEGGCTLDAAEAVVCGADIAIVEVIDVLVALVDKSMIQLDESRSILRYRLLETVHDYAAHNWPVAATKGWRCDELTYGTSPTSVSGPTVGLKAQISSIGSNGWKPSTTIYVVRCRSASMTATPNSDCGSRVR